jgi:hypothetical protein
MEIKKLETYRVVDHMEKYDKKGQNQINDVAKIVHKIGSLLSADELSVLTDHINFSGFDVFDNLLDVAYMYRMMAEGRNPLRLYSLSEEYKVKLGLIALSNGECVFEETPFSKTERELFECDYQLNEIDVLLEKGISVNDIILFIKGNSNDDHWVKSKYGELHIRFTDKDSCIWVNRDKVNIPYEGKENLY